jgi:hypothetical protein
MASVFLSSDLQVAWFAVVRGNEVTSPFYVETAIKLSLCRDSHV